MGHNEEGLLEVVTEPHKQFVQFLGVYAVEVAGRLVGKYDGGVIDQSPGHGHPLLLTSGKANAHFFVYKEIKNDAVKTNIRLLNEDERITAIARMLSGEKPTAAAMENAREMMN